MIVKSTNQTALFPPWCSSQPIGQHCSFRDTQVDQSDSTASPWCSSQPIRQHFTLQMVELNTWSSEHCLNGQQFFSKTTPRCFHGLVARVLSRRPYNVQTGSVESRSPCRWYIWARFLSLAQRKLRLCSANHRAGYFCNLTCDWLSIVWAYSEQETENGPGILGSVTYIWMAKHSSPSSLFTSMGQSGPNLANAMRCTDGTVEAGLFQARCGDSHNKDGFTMRIPIPVFKARHSRFAFYLWPSKISANELRRHTYNLFSHWLRHWWEITHVTSSFIGSYFAQP